MAICGGPVACFGRVPTERLSGYGIAPQYRRRLRVLYGCSIRHLSSGYCYLGESLGWCRDLRGGSLLRNLVDPTMVESEDFRVDPANNEPTPRVSRNQTDLPPNSAHGIKRNSNHLAALLLRPAGERLKKTATGTRMRAVASLLNHSGGELVLPRGEEKANRNTSRLGMSLTHSKQSALTFSNRNKIPHSSSQIPCIFLCLCGQSRDRQPSPVA